MKKLEMTIQKYFDRMETLHNGKNVSFDNADVEFYFQKMQKSFMGNTFVFQDLFRKSDSQIKTLSSDLIKQFEDRLGLFCSEQESINVCFANSNEVRLEFRLSFTEIDLMDYSYAFMHSSFYQKSQKIIISSDAGVFWEMVKIGAAFRKEIN